MSMLYNKNNSKSYNGVNGILLVNKPKGITSHDVVDFVRKRFRIKKVGHAGTLDPAACGLLVLLLGKSTKLSSKFMNDDKVYETIMQLGMTRDTQDSEGKITSESDCSHLKESDIVAAFSRFKGVQEQLPPMFSAVRHRGRKLYELAREGKVVERKPRSIEIYKLEITDISMPQVSFTVHCSKGTYVRQLCDDVGACLGCGAYMYSLKRTKSGRFSIEEAVTMDELRGVNRLSLAQHVTIPT